MECTSHVRFVKAGANIKSNEHVKDCSIRFEWNKMAKRCRENVLKWNILFFSGKEESGERRGGVEHACEREAC